MFGKEHKMFLKTLKPSHNQMNLIGSILSLPLTENSINRKQRAYQMTKDGFSFLVMGYTGEEAVQFRERYFALSCKSLRLQFDPKNAIR